MKVHNKSKHPGFTAAPALSVKHTAMLTIQHLEVYESFGGDIDGWARSGNNRIINDADWYLIDELLQDLNMLKSGFASKSLEATIRDKLIAATESQDVRNRLQLLSEKFA